MLFGAPPDPYFVNQYYLQNTGQNGGTVGADINVVPAWDIPLWDSTLRVAVIDEGIVAHTDLPSSRILAGRDFFAGPDPFNPGTDDDPRPGQYRNHGMACAGIMAASHNDTGVVGVFGTCEIVPVKIFSDFGAAPDSARPIAEAIYYAGSRGARVISNSWGYPTRTPSPRSRMQSAT